MSDIRHLTFVVHDPRRTARLRVEGLGAREVHDSGDRPHSLSHEECFELGGVWIAVMEGEPLPQRSYRHVAFAVAAGDLPMHRAALTPTPLPKGEGPKKNATLARSSPFPVGRTAKKKSTTLGQ